jgi:hypothetical protein
MNLDLSEGMTDGKYKKVTRDRGGDVERTTQESRKDLDDTWFGIHEQQPKVLPDGVQHATPQFIPTKPVDPMTVASLRGQANDGR